MRKATILLTAALLCILLVTPVIAAPHASVINVPKTPATIDGVISAGEWDDATPIQLNFTETLAASGDGAGIVGGTPPADHTNDDVSVSVSFKINDGYLYVLEQRTDSTLQFTRDDAQFPYASDGSLVFFCKKGENVNTSDLFIMARGKTVAEPMFEVRLDNGASQAPITAAEAKSTVTANSYVMEAKIKISDLVNVTEEDFNSGNLLVTYCAVNIIADNFSGEPSDLWGDNYQMQYVGVGSWDASPAINVVEGTPWPPAEAPSEEAPAEGETPTAPVTGDTSIILVSILAIAAATGFIVLKKHKA